MVRLQEGATCHRRRPSRDRDHVLDACCGVAWVALRGNERDASVRSCLSSHSPCHSMAADSARLTLPRGFAMRPPTRSQKPRPQFFLWSLHAVFASSCAPAGHGCLR